MRKFVFIVLFAVVGIVRADDYVDDLYYSELTALNEQLNSNQLTPYFNKKAMEELTFLPDTIPADTLVH